MRCSGGEDLRGAPVAALVLPLVEAAGHRDDVGVAELGERLGGEGRADAAGAVHDDRRVACRGCGPRSGLEVATGDVDGAGDGALLELVGLAHVEHEGAVGAELLGLGGGDLGDLRLGGVEQFPERWHDVLLRLGRSRAKSY